MHFQSGGRSVARECGVVYDDRLFEDRAVRETMERWDLESGNTKLCERCESNVRSGHNAKSFDERIRDLDDGIGIFEDSRVANCEEARS